MLERLIVFLKCLSFWEAPELLTVADGGSMQGSGEQVCAVPGGRSMPKVPSGALLISSVVSPLASDPAYHGDDAESQPQAALPPTPMRMDVIDVPAAPHMFGPLLNNGDAAAGAQYSELVESKGNEEDDVSDFLLVLDVLTNQLDRKGG